MSSSNDAMKPSSPRGRILGVFNHPAASHTFLGKILLETLAKKGYEVVMVSSFPRDQPMRNYRDIPLPGLLEDLKRREMMYFDKKKRNELKELREMTMKHTEETFLDPGVKNLLDSQEKFDLVIMDWFFNEATLMFGHIFHCPVILMSSFGNNILINEFTGNSLPFSYVPGAALPIDDNIPFKFRAIMTVVNVLYKIMIPRRKKAHHQILQRHFTNPPTIDQLQENVALVLSNSHFSFETPRPYTPNLIPIGGFHVQEPKTLPEDLQLFLDQAADGVIFFSLGSQIKSSNLNKDSIAHILKVFAKMPQKILWKYETDEIPDLPKNVKVMKWVPQLEVLAHENVKLFITHGGVLSTIESIHFHVPFLCMPFNGDQITNAAFIESRGMGRQIQFDKVTEEAFHEMLIDLTTNPSYGEKVKYFSSLMREQPIKPMDNAVFWVEHVIKHQGAPHLKVFSTKLPWYKFYMVDVIGFFLIIAFVFIQFLLMIGKFVFGICWGF